MGQKQQARRSVRRLGLWATVLCIPIVVLIPTAFDPTVVYFNPQEAFYPVKYQTLTQLIVPLLVAVLGILVIDRKSFQVPMMFPTLVYLGIAILSTLLAIDVRHAFVGDRYDGLITLASGILLFLVIGSFLDSWVRVRVLLVAITTTAVIVSLYGILQHLGLDPVSDWGITWYAGTDRVFSTIGNPLHLAAYLTLTSGTAAALYFLTDSRWEKSLWLLTMALMGACWYYTYARGSVLGVGLTVPILLWLSYRRLRSVRPLLVPAVALVLAVIAASQLGGAGASERVTATSGEGAMSAVIRLYIWRDTVPVILERPLLGHGPDNFMEAFERHEGEDLRAALFNPDTGVPDTVDKAHNEILQVTATTGFLGLAVYLWLLISYFRNAYRYGGWTMIALSGGVLAYILQLQTVFTTIATGITFWAVLGISAAIMRLQPRGSNALSSAQTKTDETQALRVAR